jgi:hypothetical protein
MILSPNIPLYSGLFLESGIAFDIAGVEKKRNEKKNNT